MSRSRRRFLSAATALVLVLWVTPAKALTFGAAADTFVDSANPALALGFLDFAEVGTHGLPKNAVDRALLRFDVSMLSPGVSILRARLRLSIGATSSDPLGLQMTAASLASDFDEATVTWDTQPPIIPSPTTSATMNAMAGDAFDINVTPLVVAQLGGATPSIVLLRVAPTNESTTNTAFFDFRTKEFVAADLRPQLIIDVGAAVVPLLSPPMLLIAMGIMLAVGAMALGRMRRAARLPILKADRRL